MPGGLASIRAPFQPEEILRVLDHHGVEYVVIGGVAAMLHGSILSTSDLDISSRSSCLSRRWRM